MSLSSNLPTNREWLRRILSGQPHQVIGDADNPYLLRWYVIPRNPLFNVYLHKFLRDDDDRALHDHPWWFISLILRGGYVEVKETDDGNLTMQTRTAPFARNSTRSWRRRGIAYRPAKHRHRVALEHGRDDAGRVSSTAPRVPCWTLIITGPRTREWGFWCPQSSKFLDRRLGKRFVPWRDFGAAGCGEVA